jgi:CRISPR-associated protein Csb2
MEEAWPVSELFGQSSEWASLTPFIPTRHPKKFRDGRPKLDESGLQIGSPEHDLRRLLKGYGFPDPDSIEEVLRYQVAGCHLHWLQFLQNRKTGNGRKAKNRFGTGFRIRFPQPVNGPIALGYGAHFSLGLFSPHRLKDADSPSVT